MTEKNDQSGNFNESKTHRHGKKGSVTIGQDSANGSAPANFVRPKPTQTPAKPAKKD
jgi:hypothetical protein